MSGNRAIWPFGFLGLLVVQTGAALEYGYTAYSSVEYTDNIRQFDSSLRDEEAGSITTGGLQFDAATEGSRTLAADVSGDFARAWYSGQGLEPEDRKFLDASFLLQPQSNNFRLTVLESLQQVAADRRSVRTVNNLRDVNILAVVPSYFVVLTPISRVLASYSYSRVDEEEDTASRDVNAATVGYEHRMSERSRWSLNVSQSQTEFDQTGFQYDQESAFLRWSYDGVLTNWSLDLGQQRVVDYPGSDEALVNFSLDRQVNRFSNVGLFYRQGYTDLTDTSVTGRLTRLVPNSDAVFADELATEDQVIGYYNYTSGPLDLRFSADARQMESKQEVSIGRPVDEDRYGLSAAADYRLRGFRNALANFGVAGSYRYVKEDFHLFDETNDVNEARLRLNYFATRSTTFYGELRSRNASGAGPGSDTDEHSFTIGIRFSPREVE